MNNIITITDDEVLQYSVGFPVLPEDLGVWHNSIKLIAGIDYTFEQITNSVILLVPVEVGDVLQLRKFTDK